MRVTHIKIRDILGIETLEFEPGQVTQITGRNATGKTSVIEAIKAAIGGGTDATLVRKGADDGEIVLLLDDGAEIRKRIPSEGRADLSVKVPEVGKVGAAQTYLNRIVDAIGINPVHLLTCPPSTRGEFLAEAMPLQVSASQLEEALGDAAGITSATELIELAPHHHAFKLISSIRKAVYDRRTGTNRVAKEKRTAADQFGAVADMGDPDELKAQRTSVEKKAKDLEAEKFRAIREADQHLATSLYAAGEAFEEAQRLAMQVRDAARQKAKDERDQVVARIEEELDAKITDAGFRLGALDAQLEAAQKASHAAAAVRTLRAEADQAEAESDLLSEAMRRLDDLKAQLLEESPLEVEVREDGEIYQDGIPFARLNHAKQVEIAFQLAMMRSGKLPLVCVDGLEALDSDAYSVLIEKAAEAQVQLVVTRVSDEALQIETIDPEPSLFDEEETDD